MEDKETFKSINFQNRPFGNLVSNFRKALNLTQNDFSKLIMISRVTTIQIEKMEDVSKLSDDLLFRFSYLSLRFKENEEFDDLVRLNAEKIYNITSATLSERITNSLNNETFKTFFKVK